MIGAAPDHALAELLAELLRPAIVDAVATVAREVLEQHARPAPEPLLSVGAAAALANVHGETIRRAIKSGRLAAVRSLGRHPRVRRSDLELFLSPTTQSERGAR
jgi:excisionase family DNA binding protein